MVEIDATKAENLNTKSVTLDDVLNDLDNYVVSSLSCNYSFFLSEDRIIRFSSKENPIVYSDCVFINNTLDLDKEYYEQHPEIKDKLIKVLSKTKTNSFFLNESFYDIDFLKSLCTNPNVNTIFFDEHTLTLEEYEIIKNSNIDSIETKDVVPELETVMDRKIGYNRKKPLFGENTMESLEADSLITITEPLSDKEMEYLKIVNDQATIVFQDFTDYENIFKAIGKLKEFNKNNKVIIKVYKNNDISTKNELNNYIKNNPGIEQKYSEVNVSNSIIETYPIETYCYYENRLIDLASRAIDMSPMEKFIYAYNVAKKYKPYKENKDNLFASRNLYDILEGDYMVCVGFAKLLMDLCEKLDIPCKSYGVDVDVGLDRVPTDAEVLPDDVVTQSGGHARLEVNIVDSKYNVDGYYLSDPTWDNVMDNDTYNFAVMTHDEYNGINRYNFLDFKNVDELFFVNSVEEFYEKVNLWLNKKLTEQEIDKQKELDKNIGEYKKHFVDFMNVLKKVDEKTYEYFNYAYGNLYNIKTNASNMGNFQARIFEVINKKNNAELTTSYRSLNSAYSRLMRDVEHYDRKEEKLEENLMDKLLKSIVTLDPQLYEQLNSEYGKYAKDEYTFVWEEEERDRPMNEVFSEFLQKFGNAIVSKVNKQVNGNTLMSAVREIYEKIYGVNEDQIDAVMDIVIEQNRERQERAFPIRYIINSDGTKGPILNPDNKFDIKSSNTKQLG